MIRKINKRLALHGAVLLSSVFALVFSATKSGQVDSSDVVLDIPVFSVETAYACDGGDCSGSGCSCDAVVPPDASSSGTDIVLSAP